LKTDCSRIKELISEYIDGLLDKEKEAEVKDHLLRCGDCRNEFEEMKAVILEIGSLDRVKAPEGFLADLHGRIEKDSWLQKVKNFLSMPARIRIPVELATLATTVVLAFFILHIVQMMPLKSPAVIEDKKSEVEIRSNEAAPVSGSRTKEPARIAATDKIMPALQKKQEVGAREAIPAASPDPNAVKELKTLKEDNMIGYGKSEANSMPDEIKEPVKIVLLLKPFGGMMAKSPESKDTVEKPAEKTARIPAPIQLQTRAKAGIAEIQSRDEALPAAKSSEEKEKPVVNWEGLFLDIEKQINNAGGIVLKKDVNKETNQPEYILIEIPGQSYPKLAEKLSEFGKVQTFFEEEAGRYNELVQIRIRIVSPNR
jgi:hypothetical protein